MNKSNADSEKEKQSCLWSGGKKGKPTPVNGRTANGNTKLGQQLQNHFKINQSNFLLPSLDCHPRYNASIGHIPSWQYKIQEPH